MRWMATCVAATVHHHASKGEFEAAIAALQIGFAMARHLENGITAAIKRAEIDASVARMGSMLTVFFRKEAPRDYAEARECDTEAFGRFHRGMRVRGVMLPPSQFETWFVSAAHSEADIDMTVKAAHEAMREAAGLPSHRNGR